MFKNVVAYEDIYSDEDVYSDEEYKSLSDNDISDDGIVNFKTLHKSNMIKRAISIRSCKKCRSGAREAIRYSNHIRSPLEL
jgi:hypothetical protein